MSFSVLADEIAKIGTQPHVCDGRFLITPDFYWEPFEKNKAFTIKELVANRIEKAR